MKKYLVCLFLTSQMFALGGIGVYGNSDMFSSTPPSSSNTSGTVTVTPEILEGGIGAGVFLYLDILPIVDIELNGELVGNLYKFSTNLAPESPGEFPWGRTSAYLTLRKKIIGIGVPFLAKLQLNGGLGYNIHSVTPNVTVDFIENAFASTTNNLEEAASQDFGQDDIMDSLAEYMIDNSISTSGFHIQFGAHAKLLMFNVFANARYTIAENVVEGESGFPSAWLGLAIGF